MALDLPKPFEHDIYLFDTYIAGTTHVEDIESINASLKENDKVNFYREPDNKYDPQAIRVETTDKRKIYMQEN